MKNEKLWFVIVIATIILGGIFFVACDVKSMKTFMITISIIVIIEFYFCSFLKNSDINIYLSFYLLAVYFLGL